MINIKKLFNYNPFRSKIRVSAGVVIILKGNKFLLCHPTNQKWFESYSFPKGGLNECESEIDAAIRELKEETSISLNKSMLENIKDPIIIDYKNKKGFNYKKVYLYITRIDSLSQIGLNSETLDKSQLQLEEIDWAGFLTKEEAEPRIFNRFSPVLDLLN